MNITVHGINPTGTVALLKERARCIKEGREASDGRKIGLIVEGGAMRGIISCASLMALEEIGMTNVFDEVYGASAGAVNAAYFLAGQANYATSIYYQKINNTRFLRRLWHRKVVDIDDLFDSIIAGDRPLHRSIGPRSRFSLRSRMPRERPPGPGTAKHPDVAGKRCGDAPLQQPGYRERARISMVD
jgi:predicted acylesterase/phospholipase RssA